MNAVTPKPGFFAQLNEKGLIEIIEMKTGAVVAIQKDDRNLLENMPDALVEHTLVDGTKVLLQRGIEPGAVAHVKSWPFSQYTADLICQLVAEGGKISEIFKRPGMPPYAAYVRWKREHPHFAASIEEAKKDRAEFMRDRALKVAEESTESDAQSSRLKVDTFKWAAGVDDSAKYSPKAKVETAQAQPVQIIISTGIDRTPIREVQDVGNNQTAAQNPTALPDGSGSAAPTVKAHG